ncbi:MarR family winged helix-turn-helix transcriptional regulator [Plantactinospora sp. CA-290183]|uniref:MarR family winged helix-turn-helix transcriptional regulator n=1 Tax=Plantactinospora sp. CA-290183 TaxID=3240006 RepID=UPI003D8A6451
MDVNERRGEWTELRTAPLGRLVTVAGHVTGQFWARHLAAHHGLTPAGMTVLFVLLRRGESTHREMAERCFVRPATLTGVVDTLERDGLVERRRDPTDRRTVRLGLTAKGEEQARTLVDLIDRNPPLTSVDADPAKAAVVRAFLLELIQRMSNGEDGRLTEQRQQPQQDGEHEDPEATAC